EEANLLPNVVYASQRDLVNEIIFPFNGSHDYIVYDLAACKETGRIQIEQSVDAVTRLCFSADGRTLAYCRNANEKGDLDNNNKGYLELIDVASGQVKFHRAGGRYGSGAGLLFSRDGNTLATTETKTNPDNEMPRKDKVIVLATATGKERWTIELEG